MNKIIPTPRDKHPDPKLRGDRISGERSVSYTHLRAHETLR